MSSILNYHKFVPLFIVTQYIIYKLTTQSSIIITAYLSGKLEPIPTDSHSHLWAV